MRFWISDIAINRDTYINSKVGSKPVAKKTAVGVDPVSPDSRRLGLGTEAQELAW